MLAKNEYNGNKGIYIMALAVLLTVDHNEDLSNFFFIFFSIFASLSFVLMIILKNCNNVYTGLLCTAPCQKWVNFLKKRILNHNIFKLNYPIILIYTWNRTEQRINLVKWEKNQQDYKIAHT